MAMERVIIAAVVVAVVAVVALLARVRRTPDAPTQRRFAVPQQLDRADFARPDAPWLVAVFTSATCDVCAAVVDRALVLESSQVVVADVEYGEQKQLHEKYAVEAVPSVVVCDAAGVTRASFLGPVNSTDLWAAVAEARDPGSTPEPDLGQH